MRINPTSIRKSESTLAALALLILSALFLTPSIRGHDGAGNYVHLMSIFNDGDLDFSNEYAAFDLLRDTPYRMSDAPIDPSTGRPANRYGIGAALFWAPAVMPVHIILRATQPDLATGLTRPYEWAVGFASAWWGGLGVWLLFIRLREQFGWRASWLAMGGLLLATPLGFYVWAHGSMSHAVSFFLAVLAVLIFERVIRTHGLIETAGLGFVGGLLFVTRYQDLTWVIALGLAIVLLWKATSNEGRDEWGRWTALACYLAGFVLATIPQLAVWRILYGSWISGPAPYLNREAGSFTGLPIHFFHALFSARHGALAWHPILLAGLAGLVLWIRQGHRDPSMRAVGWAAVIGLVLQVYLVASWSMWWAGASFGNRFFISAYPFLAFGIAWVLDQLDDSGHLWVGALVVLLLILWNCGLLIQYGSGMISREDPLAWSEILANQFTRVPEWLGARIREG